MNNNFIKFDPVNSRWINGSNTRGDSRQGERRPQLRLEISFEFLWFKTVKALLAIRSSDAVIEFLAYVEKCEKEKLGKWNKLTVKGIGTKMKWMEEFHGARWNVQRDEKFNAFEEWFSFGNVKRCEKMICREWFMILRDPNKSSACLKN